MTDEEDEEYIYMYILVHLCATKKSIEGTAEREIQRDRERGARDMRERERERERESRQPPRRFG